MECPACHHANIDGARFCAKCGAPLPSAPSEEDPLIGSIVGGRYRITGVLGEGGMGRVYTAEQQMGTTVRKAAVKTLLAQYAKDPQVLARFNRECGTVAELKHPNTIQVWDFGQTNSGELYIAMELLEGSPLEDELAQKGPMPPERVDKIIGQAAGSLQEAHSKGIVHRDLKPANLFLTKIDGDDFVKVLDFGIAKRGERPDSKEQKLTQQGTVLGTPPYMSPEQFRGQELDARSDVYSLAIVAYEMLTGRLPFEADTPWAWATQHLTAQPSPFEVTQLGAQVPPKMKAAIMRALEKDKNKRQSSVREFYEELSIGAGRASIVGGATGQQQVAGTAAMPGLPSGQYGMPSGQYGMPSGQMQGMPSGQMQGMPSGQMPARPGGTQIGEPLFAQGVPSAPGGRTMVDTGPSAVAITPGPMPVVPMQQHGHAPMPMGGPAYPAPPPPPMGGRQQQKSSPVPIIAGIGALVVVGIVIAIFATRGGKSGGDGEVILMPSAAPTTVVVASDPTAAPADSAGTAGTASSAGGSTQSGQTTGTNTGSGSGSPATTASGSGGGGGTKVDAAGDKACDAAITYAYGGNTTMAISQYRSCTGPKRSKALSAIDASAAREVKSKGCAAKATADAAAAIGASSGKAALPPRCK
ncbi:serine/threonine-protein kinase [Polyangium sp. y55x31]|uniref:protein kinase domain-containing protein n=1 Tax=Polyangium sp. y55x31 TaxID=3042688 RepID=UPI0024832C38|nr:serine/threonine-protein kinase [Polyangium sp. y55x31]MDI1478614.1 serine/threonine-protein kinase [Polyangium sp. y55x31]